MAFSCTETIRRRRTSISRFADNLNDLEDETGLCLTVNSASVKPTCLPSPLSSAPDAPAPLPTLRENNKSQSNSQKLMAHHFYCSAPQLQPMSFPHRESFAFLTEHCSKCYTQCVQQRFPEGPAHTHHIQPGGQHLSYQAPRSVQRDKKLTWWSRCNTSEIHWIYFKSQKETLFKQTK